MTVYSPEPDDTSTVEPKVKWAALGTYLSGVVSLALVNAFTENDNQLLIETLPDVIEPFLLPMVPAVVAAIAGFFAKHQWRRTEVSMGARREPGGM